MPMKLSILGNFRLLIALVFATYRLAHFFGDFGLFGLLLFSFPKIYTLNIKLFIYPVSFLIIGLALFDLKIMHGRSYLFDWNLRFSL